MTVAITPPAKASSPCPMHTGCTREALCKFGEEDENNALEVVVVITV